MISRKITIPLIIFVVAVVVLVVSINQPFQPAEANMEQQNNVIETNPIQDNESTNPIQPASAPETIQPTQDPNLPSVKKNEEPSDLVTVTQRLKDKINTTLLHPGWVRVSKEYTSYVERQDAVTVPETGQVIPKDYILNQWLLVGADLGINVHFIHGVTPGGEEYTATLTSKDERWPSTDTTSLATTNLPNVLGTNTLDDIIAMGFAGDANIEYLSEDGINLVAITIITQFPRPVSFNGWEDARVVEYALTNFYDWETGMPLRLEEWITRDDGSKMLAGLSVYTLSHENELPLDVLDRMNQMGE